MSFTLYGAQSPNALRAVIYAELLKVPYNLKVLSFSKGEHKSPEYLKVSPTGQMPGLSYTNEAGKLVSIGESGAIITFLTEKYDKQHKFSYGLDSEFYGEGLYWLFFGVATFSPAFGAALTLKLILKQEGPHVDNAIAKYTSYFDLLEKHLEGRKYIAGDKLTSADVSCFPSVRSFGFLTGKTLEPYPNVEKWFAMMNEVDGVKSALGKLY